MMYRNLLTFTLFFLLTLSVGAQTKVDGDDAEPIPGPLRSSYIPEGPGDKMVLTDDISDAFVKSANVLNNVLTIVGQGDDDVEYTITFTGGGGSGSDDGVLSGATLNTTTQMLTLSVTTGSDYVVDLSGFTNSTEVSDEITTATSGFLTEAEVDARARSITANWAEEGNSDAIPSDKLGNAAGDGVVNTLGFTGTTLTVGRSNGLPPLSVSGIGGSGGEATADGVVSSMVKAADGTVTLGRTESIGTVTATGNFNPITPVGTLPIASAADRTTIYGDGASGATAEGLYYRKEHLRTTADIRWDVITSRAGSTTTTAIGWSNVAVPTLYGTGGQILPSRPPGLQAFLRTVSAGEQRYRIRVTDDLTTQATLYIDIRDIANDTFIENVAVTRATGETDHISTAYTISNIPFRTITSVHDQTIIRIRTADNQDDASLLGLLDGNDAITKLADAEDLSKTVAEGHEYAEGIRTDLQTEIDDNTALINTNVTALVGKADTDLQNISLNATEQEATRNDLGLGSAATHNTGTDAGEIPVLLLNGLLDRARLPSAFSLGQGAVVLATDAEVVADGTGDDVLTAGHIPILLDLIPDPVQYVQPFDAGGTPPDAPSKQGDIAVSPEGKAFVAGARRVTHSVAPSFSLTPNLAINAPSWDHWKGAGLRGHGTPDPGDFTWNYVDHQRFRWRDTSNNERSGTWAHLYDFFRGEGSSLISGSPAALFGGSSRSVFVTCDTYITGACRTDAEAAEAVKELSLHDTSIDTTTTPFVWLRGVGISEIDMNGYVLTYSPAGEFNPGTSVVNDFPFWTAPLARTDDPCLIPESGETGKVLAKNSDGHCDAAWTDRKYRGEYRSTDSYTVGDIVHDGTDFWVARANVTGTAPTHGAATSWEIMTSNMEYFPTHTSDNFYRQGYILRHDSKYWLRTGTGGTDLPAASPGSWQEIATVGQFSPGTCHVRHYFHKASPNSFLLATDHANQESNFHLDITPQATTSRIIVKTNFTVRGNGASNVDDAGVRYSLSRDNTRITEERESYLNLGNANIEHYHADVTLMWSDEPNTEDEITYSMKLRRMIMGGTSMPVELRQYEMEIVDYSNPGEGCGGGGGGADDGIATGVDLSTSDRDLTVTVERSVGGDLTSTVALPDPDYGNVATDILPDSDGSHGVGSSGRTFRFGHFEELHVDNTLDIGGDSLAEYVDDQVNTLIVAGTNLTKTYDDSAGTLTLNASGSGGGGGDGTITTALPVSGDGSAGDPATIADGAIGLGKLTAEVQNDIIQGGVPVSGLVYGINQSATGRDTGSYRWIGNIYQAQRDITLRGFTANINGPDNTPRTRRWQGAAFKVARSDATTYNATATTTFWDIHRPGHGWGSDVTHSVDDLDSSLETRGTLHLEENDYFFTGFLVTHVFADGDTAPDVTETYLVAASGADENDHINHADFPHDYINYVAYGRNNHQGDRFISSQNFYHNDTNALRMQVYYDAINPYDSLNLGSVATDILPNTDNSHGVGSSSHTFRFGHFTELTADDTLRLGTQDMGDAYVGSDISGSTITFTQADASTETLTVPTGGSATDLTNVATDILPSADTTRNVGTTARTFASGHFQTMTVDNILTLGTRSLGDAYVQSSIADNVITFTQADGSTNTITVPSGGGTPTPSGPPVNLIVDELAGINWSELTLDVDLPTSGTVIEFRVSPRASGAGAYGLAMAEAIARTPATSTAPTDITDALPVKTSQPESTQFGHGTFLVQKSDEANKLWVRMGRATAETWTIRSYPRGGGDGGMGGSVDLGNVTESILPDSDGSHGVGSAARTFNFGHFGVMNVDTTLNLGSQNMGDALVGASIANQVITFPQADGSEVTVTVPSSGGGDGTITTALPISGDGSAGDPATIADDAITLAKILRHNSGSQVAGGVLKNLTNGSGSVAFGLVHDAEISGMGASKLTGTIVDARLPAAITRDTEIAGLIDTLAVVSGNQLLSTNQDGSTSSITLPTGIFEVAAVSPVQSTLADADEFVFADQSENGNPNTRISAANARFYFHGGITPANVPDLPASKITSGIFNTARIPTPAAGSIPESALDIDNAPSLGDVLHSTGTGLAWAGANITIERNNSSIVSAASRVDFSSDFGVASSGGGAEADITIGSGIARDSELPSVAAGSGLSVVQSGTVYTVSVNDGFIADLATITNSLPLASDLLVFEDVSEGLLRKGTVNQLFSSVVNGAHGLIMRLDPNDRAFISLDIADLDADSVADDDEFVFEDKSETNDHNPNKITAVNLRTYMQTGLSGGSTDLTAITTDVTPSTDNSGNVGTEDRTWSNGRFTNLTVDGTLTATTNATVGGITVTGDLEAQNDIHLGDRDQIVLGTGIDATFDYDDRTSHVEVRLNTGADAFVIYDGTGNTTVHELNKDGTSSLVTDTDLDVDTPANEGINVAPSRQAVAEAINAKGLNVIAISQTNYDALATKDAGTLYVIQP